MLVGRRQRNNAASSAVAAESRLFKCSVNGLNNRLALCLIANLMNQSECFFTAY